MAGVTGPVNAENSTVHHSQFPFRDDSIIEDIGNEMLQTLSPRSNPLPATMYNDQFMNDPNSGNCQTSIADGVDSVNDLSFGMEDECDMGISEWYRNSNMLQGFASVESLPREQVWEAGSYVPGYDMTSMAPCTSIGDMAIPFGMQCQPLVLSSDLHCFSTVDIP